MSFPSTIAQLWAKADRPAVRAFFLSIAALGVALLLALYSGAARELDRVGLSITSALGALVGGFTIIALFGLGLNICLDGSGCPQPPFPSTENLVLFTVLIGLFGAGQALTLAGWSRKLGWFITSVIAGAVFGEGLQVVSTIVGANPAKPGIGPSIAAGIGCGAVLGAGALLLRQRAMD